MSTLTRLIRPHCRDCASPVAWVDRLTYIDHLETVTGDPGDDLASFIPLGSEHWICTSCPASGHLQ